MKHKIGDVKEIKAHAVMCRARAKLFPLTVYVWEESVNNAGDAVGHLSEEKHYNFKTQGEAEDFFDSLT